MRFFQKFEEPFGAFLVLKEHHVPWHDAKISSQGSVRCWTSQSPCLKEISFCCTKEFYGSTNGNLQIFIGQLGIGYVGFTYIASFCCHFNISSLTNPTQLLNFLEILVCATRISSTPRCEKRARGGIHEAMGRIRSSSRVGNGRLKSEHLIHASKQLRLC